jgi:hypothetical protein
MTFRWRRNFCDEPGRSLRRVKCRPACSQAGSQARAPRREALESAPTRRREWEVASCGRLARWNSFLQISLMGPTPAAIIGNLGRTEAKADWQDHPGATCRPLAIEAQRSNLFQSATAACYRALSNSRRMTLAKAVKKKRTRKPYSAADIKLLKQHSRARTPVAKIVKQMKRSEGSLRQKALALGIGLGHQR